MSYFGVLGYTNNPLVLDYEEKYFQRIFFISKEILGENHRFFLKKEEDQKMFLLHPDISSLLMDYFGKRSPSSQERFLQELDLFLTSQYTKLTSNSGIKIKGTNIYLSLEDNNPDNGIISHPDHDQNGMLGWGEKTPEEWDIVFAKSLDLLKNINEDFYNEINSIIKKIVPMKTSIDTHNSCSYKNCIGTLYLGYTINSQFPEFEVLEALIHESSHNKLNLIMQSEKLLLNDDKCMYYSPYRPDARHILGVYLGVHAVVPTVYILLNAIELGYITDQWWHEKIIFFHIKNKLGYRVLQRYAKTTKIGREILEDIGKIITLSDALISQSKILIHIDKINITQNVKLHFLEVQMNYPYMQY